MLDDIVADDLSTGRDLERQRWVGHCLGRAVGGGVGDGRRDAARVRCIWWQRCLLACVYAWLVGDRIKGSHTCLWRRQRRLTLLPGRLVTHGSTGGSCDDGNSAVVGRLEETGDGAAFPVRVKIVGARLLARLLRLRLRLLWLLLCCRVDGGPIKQLLLLLLLLELLLLVKGVVEDEARRRRGQRRRRRLRSELLLLDRRILFGGGRGRRD